ncbi:putative uncharacterized protein [Acidaminococcus sp. CAG:917]|nr:putative uncharacterized protein [Acidaminococcus sp. CAG:917]
MKNTNDIKSDMHAIECPNCGKELKKLENGLLQCKRCKKLFRPLLSGFFLRHSFTEVEEVSVKTEKAEPIYIKPAEEVTEQPSQDKSVKNKPKKKKASYARYFFRRYGLSVFLPLCLVIAATVILLTCFVGVRGIYVNVENPNEYFSFNPIVFEYQTDEGGVYRKMTGTWLNANGVLTTTHTKDGEKVVSEYSFSHNNFDMIFLTDSSGSRKIYKRVSLLAISTVQKVDINLVYDSPSISNSSQKISIGDYLEMPSVPKREGYNFRGWYTSRDGWKDADAVAFNFGNRVWEDVTLYANWQSDTEYFLTGDGISGEPIGFLEGVNLVSVYVTAMGWASLPDDVLAIEFYNDDGKKIDGTSAPRGNVRVKVVKKDSVTGASFSEDYQNADNLSILSLSGTIKELPEKDSDVCLTFSDLMPYDLLPVYGQKRV